MPVPKHSNLPFTEKQWQWVADRFREGYTQTILGEFLGVNRYTVMRHLQQMGVLPYARDELDPLESRKQEFMDLEKD